MLRNLTQSPRRRPYDRIRFARRSTSADLEYLDRDLPDATALAPVFDTVSFWGARFGALLLDELPSLGGRVLDVACGTGFPALELAARLGGSSRVIGVDVWGAALRRACVKRDAYRCRRVDFVAADGVALPFADASFDLVVSNLGINNFDDPGAVARECARVSRPGAALALTTNLEGHMRELYAVYGSVVAELCDAAALERLRANEAHRGTEEWVSALLAGAGFTVTRSRRDRLALRYADGSALLRDPLVRLGFLPGWRTVPGPGQERRVFSELERRLNEIAAARGQLAMEIPMLYVEARLSAGARDR